MGPWLEAIGLLSIIFLAGTGIFTIAVLILEAIGNSGR